MSFFIYNKIIDIIGKKIKSNISSPTYHHIIIGDFNYHFNATSNPHIMFTNLTN